MGRTQSRTGDVIGPALSNGSASLFIYFIISKLLVIINYYCYYLNKILINLEIIKNSFKTKRQPWN